MLFRVVVRRGGGWRPSLSAEPREDGDVADSFGEGADGVALSDEEDGEVAHLIEERLEALGPELDALGIGRDRVMFIPMLLPIYKVLPKMIETFDRKVASLGPLTRQDPPRATRVRGDLPGGKGDRAGCDRPSMLPTAIQSIYGIRHRQWP